MSGHTPTIRICTGTTCYVLGAAELLDELEQAVADHRLHAQLEGTTCLGNCKSGRSGSMDSRPPYVEIEGHTVAVSSLDQLQAVIGGGE